MTRKERFVNWLDAKVGRERMLELMAAMDEVEAYAKKKKMIVRSIYGVTDPGLSFEIADAVYFNKSWRFSDRKKKADRIAAADLFNQYMEELRANPALVDELDAQESVLKALAREEEIARQAELEQQMDAALAGAEQPAEEALPVIALTDPKEETDAEAALQAAGSPAGDAAGNAESVEISAAAEGLAGAAEGSSSADAADAEQQIEDALGSMVMPGEIADPLLLYLHRNGLHYIDLRAQRGCLWIIGGQEIAPLIQPLKDNGIFIFRSAGGSSLTGGKDAWWTKDNPKKLVLPEE